MPHEDKPAGHQAQTGQLDKEEIRLWRLHCGFSFCSPSALRRLPGSGCRIFPTILAFVALGLVAVAVLFAVYVYGRRRQVFRAAKPAGRVGKARQGGALRRAAGPTQPGAGRSQRSFKELIDAFDDVAFAASLDGTLRTVNRRVTQVLGLSYSEIVGHRLMNSSSNPHSAILRMVWRDFWSEDGGRES